MQGQTLVADDGGTGDIFGYSVSFKGTTAVIGAYANNTYQGAAYVFGLTDGTWTQTQKLVADDGASNTYFGYATALSGPTLLIGAWGSNPGGVDTQGAAYIFTQADGAWTQTQKLVANDGGIGDKFGHSVALQGTTALIGADGWSASTAQGAVYEFDGSGGTFVQTQTLVASDGAPADQFGLPVTLDGDNALVGSWLWSAPDSTMPGSAYFFTRAPSDVIFADGFDEAAP
ncbi:MAG: FG-GAP repeat protein [Dokdonella sp.]|uniref:FG-GAP repeat protein n=1 Tax=Dokdonella sp. TaxID=2291710 RepID=UPI003267C0FD